jgi:rubrerythrin
LTKAAIFINFDKKAAMIPVAHLHHQTVRFRISILLSIMTLACLQAFPFPPDGKTADNLLAAYIGEMTASAKYAAFSEQAHKEGYHQIGLLFSAASRSEAIHAANHKTVLEKMGKTVAPFTAPGVIVKSTKENLELAINGETIEVAEMYPEYIAVAKSENVTNAVKSMRWAMETEKRHTIFFRNAMAALNSNSVPTLPMFYWVCPKCGNTYDVPAPENMCSFCGTANTRFIKVNK